MFISDIYLQGVTYGKYLHSPLNHIIDYCHFISNYTGGKNLNVCGAVVASDVDYRVRNASYIVSS